MDPKMDAGVGAEKVYNLNEGLAIEALQPDSQLDMRTLLTIVERLFSLEVCRGECFAVVYVWLALRVLFSSVLETHVVYCWCCSAGAFVRLDPILVLVSCVSFSLVVHIHALLLTRGLVLFMSTHHIMYMSAHTLLLATRFSMLLHIHTHIYIYVCILSDRQCIYKVLHRHKRSVHQCI
jgi:hypothetical protein